MNNSQILEIHEAKKEAVEILLHNSQGPFKGLPRTAGWGYPEPYTRDLMFSILGIAVTGNKILLDSIRVVLETLASNQTERGHIPSLVHDIEDRGSSDSTPLFLFGTGIFRLVTGEKEFLKEAVAKALVWMEYQSPDDRFLVAQQPASDWRHEQWVTGYGLFVNTLVYNYLRLLGHNERADMIRRDINKSTVTDGTMHPHTHVGLSVKTKPYYALWSYKIHSSERFDLLGNSIAILSGIASQSRADEIITWIESECLGMKKKGELALDLPPNFFPFILPGDTDWHLRYSGYNNPGEYHNGGIWPFVCGFYIAALVAAKRYKLAEEKLLSLTHLNRISNKPNIGFGFNEWFKAQDGRPMGEDWQTWSASLYLYAAKCVEEGVTPFFDKIRMPGNKFNGLEGSDQAVSADM